MKLIPFFLIFFCFLYGQTSYSAKDCNGIPFDEKLTKILNFDNGIFIEIGANDGVTQSNTMLLETLYNWSGILVDPSIINMKSLLINRPKSKCFQCAVGSFEEDGTFAYGDFDGNLMSSIDGTRLQKKPSKKVLIRSLQSILDELNIHHINFFSLDTEGHELNVLNGIDFDKTTFDYLLIEIYTKDYAKINSLLKSHGYKMVDLFSNYSHETNQTWDGTHNDFLFKKL